MIGRAAERDRQPKRAQPWIDQIEQRCIFQRKQAGEPGVVGIANVSRA